MRFFIYVHVHTFLYSLFSVSYDILNIPQWIPLYPEYDIMKIVFLLFFPYVLASSSFLLVRIESIVLENKIEKSLVRCWISLKKGPMAILLYRYDVGDTMQLYLFNTIGIDSC